MKSRTSKKRKPSSDSIEEALKTKKDRKSTAQTLTLLAGAQQAGRVPSAFPKPEERAYRSYKGEREPQALRQIATQIVLQSRDHSDVEKIIEIQLMHLTTESGSNIFIAGNPIDSMQSLTEELNSPEKLKAWLTTEVENAKGEDKLRNVRHAKKLEARAYESEEEEENDEDDNITQDKERTKQIFELLKNTSTLTPLKISYQKESGLPQLTEKSKNIISEALNQTENIYIVTGECAPHQDRHAEEFLCDIYRIAKNNFSEPMACICGKKRPCTGCLGRIQSEKVDIYNPRSGRFWTHTIEGQPAVVAKETLQLLKQKHFISLGQEHEPRQDYASGSDSEFTKDDSSASETTPTTESDDEAKESDRQRTRRNSF